MVLPSVKFGGGFIKETLGYFILANGINLKKFTFRTAPTGYIYKRFLATPRGKDASGNETPLLRGFLLELGAFLLKKDHRNS
jgi:hypothetical protein